MAPGSLPTAFLVPSDPARDVPAGGFLKQERLQFRKGGTEFNQALTMGQARTEGYI